MQSVLPKIVTTGFRAIQLIYFFTAGADEVKCWQIRKGSKAPQASRHHSVQADWPWPCANTCARQQEAHGNNVETLNCQTLLTVSPWLLCRRLVPFTQTLSAASSVQRSCPMMYYMSSKRK